MSTTLLVSLVLGLFIQPASAEFRNRIDIDIKFAAAGMPSGHLLARKTIDEASSFLTGEGCSVVDLTPSLHEALDTFGVQCGYYGSVKGWAVCPEEFELSGESELGVWRWSTIEIQLNAARNGQVFKSYSRTFGNPWRK